jgi:hypothetical protein
MRKSILPAESDEIVRQQWNFSASGSTSEEENYAVALAGVFLLTRRRVRLQRSRGSEPLVALAGARAGFT